MVQYTHIQDFGQVVSGDVCSANWPRPAIVVFDAFASRPMWRQASFPVRLLSIGEPKKRMESAGCWNVAPSSQPNAVSISSVCFVLIISYPQQLHGSIAET